MATTIMLKEVSIPHPPASIRVLPPTMTLVCGIALELTQAAPNAVTTIMDTWNTAVEETAYIEGVTEKLNALGFTK